MIVYDEAAFIDNWDEIRTMPRRKGWVTVHFPDGNTISWNQKTKPDVAAIAAYFGVSADKVEAS